MRRIFLVVISILSLLLVTPIIASAQNSVFNPSASGGFTQAVTSPITYYVAAKAAGGTCVYNGDGGTVCTPSDAGACISKAAPCATIAGAFAKFTQKIPLAIITVQLADTAGTGTDCYSPNRATLTMPSYSSQNLSVEQSAFTAETYPPFYVYIVGNTTTPASVLVNGSGGGCTARSIGTVNGLTFDGGIVRIQGVKFQGYGSTTRPWLAAGPVTGNGSLMYAEDITCVGDEDEQVSQSGVCVSTYQKQGLLKLGGNWTVSNMGWISAINSTIYTTDPRNSSTQNTTLNYTNSNATPVTQMALSQFGSMIYVDRLKLNLFGNAAGNGSGTGTYNAWLADLFSSIIYTEVFSSAQCANGFCIDMTINAANITWEQAAEGSFIDYSCTNGTQENCTLTSGPSVAAKVDRGSYIAENVVASGANNYSNWSCVNNYVGTGTTPQTQCGDNGVTFSGANIGLSGIGSIGTHGYTKGTISAAGDVVCFTAANQLGDCPTSGATPVGIANDTNTAPNVLMFPGSQKAINLDSSQTYVFGYYACASLTVAGQAYTQIGPCTKSWQVGVVRASATATTAQITFYPAPPTITECVNTAASAAITGSSKQYLSINCSIPANALRAGSVVSLEVRGVYSGNVTDTLTMTVDACTVSGCGSGTVVNLATTSAFTLTAVSNQYWEADEQIICFTGGASGTLDTQGKFSYETGGTTILADATPNTTTATVSTVVAEFISISVTFSSASASDSITARQFTARIQ